LLRKLSAVAAATTSNKLLKLPQLILPELDVLLAKWLGSTLIKLLTGKHTICADFAVSPIHPLKVSNPVKITKP